METSHSTYVYIYIWEFMWKYLRTSPLNMEIHGETHGTYRHSIWDFHGDFMGIKSMLWHQMEPQDCQYPIVITLKKIVGNLGNSGNKGTYHLFHRGFWYCIFLRITIYESLIVALSYLIMLVGSWVSLLSVKLIIPDSPRSKTTKKSGIVVNHQTWEISGRMHGHIEHKNGRILGSLILWVFLLSIKKGILKGRRLGFSSGISLNRTPLIPMVYHHFPYSWG